MAGKKSKEIFFHVGLGKTGSTYLQYKVFPKFKNIHYIQRNKYKKSFRIIRNTNLERYLVSSEFDVQYTYQLHRIAKEFPEAGIIVVLRRQDSWLASEYRRYVKNGISVNFNEFVDLENDTGVWKQKEAYFWPRIELALKLFERKPLVLLHEGLKNHPLSFIRKIAQYTNAQFKKEDISLAPKHKSYGRKQLLIRRRLNKTFTGNIRLSSHKFIAHIQKWLVVKPVRCTVLFLANLVPGKFVSKEDLIPQDYLHKIQKFYQDDWKKCTDYASSLK